MMRVIDSLAGYSEYLTALRLHILVMDCAICSLEDLPGFRNYLISPIAGAYFSGEQVELFSDTIGDMVSEKSEPTGEFSGFDLRWARGEDGLIKNLWQAKFSSFLSGSYDIIVLTADVRFKNDDWVEEQLQIFADSY